MFIEKMNRENTKGITVIYIESEIPQIDGNKYHLIFWKTNFSTCKKVDEMSHLNYPDEETSHFYQPV